MILIIFWLIVFIFQNRRLPIERVCERINDPQTRAECYDSIDLFK